MKFLVSILFTASFTLNSVAQEVTANIKKVTVFQQGAQVTHSGKANVNAGISKITLKGLTQYVDANSIQVKLGDAKIISLNYWVDYLSNGESNKLKTMLQDSLDKVSYLMESEKNNKLSYEQELKLIETNVSIKGQAVLDAIDIEDFLAFYRSNLPVIRTKILDTDIKIRKHQKTLSRIQQTLNNVNSNPNNVSGVLDIEVSDEAKSTQDISISYFVHNAGWEPYYNMRASAANQPIEMEYNANVYQNTGIDWKGIELTLATGTPHLDNNIPVLNPWWLNFYYPQARIEYKSKANMKMEQLQEVQDMAPVASYSLANSKPVQISENLTFFEFKIATPYNINADGQKQRVEISKHNLAADFSYVATPKMNNNAYLVARVPGWDQYKMLSGNSKIYFEGTYVGESFIDVHATEDTLTLSLGQDKNIIIEREILKNKSSKNTLGSKKEIKQAVEIRIRNSKNTMVKIKVLDQYPVSQNAEIKVKVGETSSAKNNVEKGELEWDLEIQPNKNAQLNFDFEISFPKNQNVNL